MNSIAFTWQVLNDGGSALIDNDVYYDQSTGVWILLEAGVVGTSYQTTIDLLSGREYKFKVTARNSVGSSAFSLEVGILAAQEPDAPMAPTTAILGD